jgi:hypothetical protein
MKRAFGLSVIVVILCVTGCRDQTNPIPPTPNSFRVTVNTIYESSDLLVKQAIIEAPGQKKVSITQKTGTFGVREVWIDPVQDTNPALAEVTFVAALVKTSKSANMIKLLIRIKGKIQSAGDPLTYPVKAENLSDILQLQFDQNTYPLGQDIVIGKFLGEPIVLSVKNR